MASSSNALQYPQSRREPQNMPCNYIHDGFCMGYMSCPQLSFSGFRPLGNLEMEIRALLIAARPLSVLLIDHLPRFYYWQYQKHLHADGSFLENQWGMKWNGILQCDGMAYSLSILHTITTFRDSYGNLCVSLLDDTPCNQDGNGADQIYITFRATNGLSEGHIRNYFSHYGIITDVHIPVVDSIRRFGFVKFLHCKTVNLLLAEWDNAVPHIICGTKVFAKPYKSRTERSPTEGDNNVIQLLDASDGPKEDKVPEHNIPCSGENEGCQHHLCGIITSTGMLNVCAECRKLFSQIIEVVRMREKCSECGELLSQVTKSMRRSENCARCRQLLRQMIVCIQQKE